ncbi:MAG: tyrosine-type recombinase/integrase [Mesorhizobium sp.]
MEKTFNEAAESYLANGGEARYLPPIVSHFDGRPLRSIFPFDVRQMATTILPGRSAATMNRQAMTPARAVIMHGYDRGWCDLIRLKQFRQEKPARKQPASPVWLGVFCRQADRDGLHHLSALVIFMAHTGARISEAVELRWPEVDLGARTALLLKTKTETNSLRYLTDDLVERMRRMEADADQDDPVFRYRSRHSVSERIAAVCMRAEIPYKSPHLCGRHTFATAAIDAGIDVRTAMDAGGWRSSSVFLETYVHSRRTAGRMVADRLNASGFGAM